MKNSARRDCGKNRQSGFTLIEILIVLVIIAILAAILFPVFSSAREKARQTSCASNLQQIYTAVTLYKQDEKRYPASIAVLLPKDAALDNPATPAPATVNVNGQACDTSAETCPNARGTGYLKSTGNLLCPNEARDTKVGISSYGDVSTGITRPTPAVITADNMGRYVWDYWGYKTDGTVYLTPPSATDVPDGSLRLVNPQTSAVPPVNLAYNAQSNPIKNSMSNRFAPTSTIITHCVYHRYQTSSYEGDDIYLAANGVNDARDIVLTLDGVAKSVNVSHYNVAGTGWQK